MVSLTGSELDGTGVWRFFFAIKVFKKPCKSRIPILMGYFRPGERKSKQWMKRDVSLVLITGWKE